MEERDSEKVDDWNDTNTNINRVLFGIRDRLLFRGLKDSALELKTILAHIFTQNGGEETTDRSSERQTANDRFDVGDNDNEVFIYTGVSLTSKEEAVFEYSADNPLRILLPEDLSHLDPVDNRYLNANALKSFDPSLFGKTATLSLKEANLPGFANLTILTNTNVNEKPTTLAETYLGTDHHNKDNAHNLDLDCRLQPLWHAEHSLFTYLLERSVGVKLKLVQELLFEDKETVQIKYGLAESLMLHIGILKNDFQRALISIHDIVYFRKKDFCELLDQVVDESSIKSVRSIQQGEYSCHLVPAIRCAAWPRPAQAFKDRQREWPPRRVVDEIVETGCVFVSKTSEVEPMSETGFMLSFNRADATLVGMLPQELSEAYHVLMTVYNSCKDSWVSGNCLTKIHFKHAVLWIAESRSLSCKEEGPLQCIRWICEFLLQALRKKFMPCFYVETGNIIDHFTDTDVEHNIIAISEISRNPANFVKIVIEQTSDIVARSFLADKFLQITDPDQGISLSDMHVLKMYAYNISRVGGYQIDDVIKNAQKMSPESMYKRYVKEAFNTNPTENAPIDAEITEAQMKAVCVLVKTLSDNKLDLFNVLNFPLSEDIMNFELASLPGEVTHRYFQPSPHTRSALGEHILAALRLRLKYYGNTFHVLCTMLHAATFTSATSSYKNHDAVYVIRFLRALVARQKFNAEKVDDLLHSLFYFCHCMRLRHNELDVSDQMLRSVREFLQDAGTLMSVYFSPRLGHPTPADVRDRIANWIEKCHI